MSPSVVRRCTQCALVAVGLMFSIAMQDVLAQAKPALVRDVDAPGSQPVTIQCSNTTFVSGSFGCSTAADRIPAGKRFTVTAVSVYMDTTDAGTLRTSSPTVRVVLNGPGGGTSLMV